MVWIPQSFIKDPSTGKRISRPNPPEKWIRSEVLHLRIVDDELWNAVRARQKEIAVRFEATAEGVRKAKARKLHEKKRPVSLLSGLLTCGCRAGKYGLIMRDRYGCTTRFGARRTPSLSALHRFIAAERKRHGTVP